MLKKGPDNNKSTVYIYKFKQNIDKFKKNINTYTIDNIQNVDFTYLIDNIDFKSIKFINELYILIDCIEQNNFNNLHNIYIQSLLDYIYNLINNTLYENTCFYFMQFVIENNITNIKQYIINRIHSFIEYFKYCFVTNLTQNTSKIIITFYNDKKYKFSYNLLFCNYNFIIKIFDCKHHDIYKIYDIHNKQYEFNFLYDFYFTLTNKSIQKYNCIFSYYYNSLLLFNPFYNDNNIKYPHKQIDNYRYELKFNFIHTHENNFILMFNKLQILIQKNNTIYKYYNYKNNNFIINNINYNSISYFNEFDKYILELKNIKFSNNINIYNDKSIITKLNNLILNFDIYIKKKFYYNSIIISELKKNNIDINRNNYINLLIKKIQQFKDYIIKFINTKIIMIVLWTKSYINYINLEINLLDIIINIYFDDYRYDVNWDHFTYHIPIKYDIIISELSTFNEI